jgi:hypothetical protein
MASPKQLLECVARYDYIILLTKSSVPLLSAAPSAAVDDKGSKGQAEVAPEVQALLLVDDDGRAFIEDANGNHVRVFINDKVSPRLAALFAFCRIYKKRFGSLLTLFYRILQL